MCGGSCDFLILELVKFFMLLVYNNFKGFEVISGGVI